MSAMVGLLPENALQRGSILLQGQELTGAPDKVMRRIRGRRVGYVPQDPMTSLNPTKRIAAQVAESLLLHRLCTRSEAKTKVHELLRAAGLTDVERVALSFPHELSGGMRQRVMIAMALALRPQLMVMDEPTTALDVLVQREILKQISQLRHEFGFSVIFITHDLPLLLEISDRIAVMREGEIIELALAEQIWTRPQHDYTRTLLSSFPRLTGARGVLTR
jgi:peptide/nickel transport system ATP-binding protein